MEQPPPPLSTVSPAPVALAFRAPLPRGILAGIVLALAGVSVSGLSWAWSRNGVSNIGSLDELVARVQVSNALAAAQALVTGLGLFLILMGIARLLAGSSPWCRVGASLVLIGALVRASVQLTLLWLAPSLYSPPGPTAFLLIINVMTALVEVGGVASGVGILLALIGIARGALARSAAPAS